MLSLAFPSDAFSENQIIQSLKLFKPSEFAAQNKDKVDVIINAPFLGLCQVHKGMHWGVSELTPGGKGSSVCITQFKLKNLSTFSNVLAHAWILQEVKYSWKQNLESSCHKQ